MDAQGAASVVIVPRAAGTSRRCTTWAAANRADRRRRACPTSWLPTTLSLVDTPPASSSGEQTPLRCLLLSPVSPPDVHNGDAQYTEDLMRYPPQGIQYVAYTEALASGEIEWGPSLRSVATWRASPVRLGAALVRAGIHVLRRFGLLLPDPIRWIRVRGRFDLVHAHCMPVRFLGPRPPVLLSDSAGTFWYWTAGRGLPAAKVDRLLRRERRLARAVRYLHPTARPAGDALLLFIEAGRALARRIGVDASAAVICAPGVPPARRASRADGSTLLFVGRAFEYKGGTDALEIFRRVRAQLPEATLIVAGPEQPLADVEGVEWVGSSTRDGLYSDVYPRADVFVYPTRFDCAPLVVQEALAHGIPVVAPRIFGLPELVRDGETGRLFEPGDIAAAVQAVLELLTDEAALAAAKAAAVRDYERRFSVTHRNALLGPLYRSLVS
jgi:glycosyltransferase involved in cell wall biosynthesis